MLNWEKLLQDLKIDATKLVTNLIVIVIVLFLANLLLKRLTKATTKIIDKAQKDESGIRSKDIVTSMTLLRSVGRYGIYFVAFIIIINQLGYGSVISNIVTAAGVGALAISLGAQSILKDMIAGLFITFEKQYRVGDFVSINGNEGTVTSIAMRCTYLQSWKGQKIIIPNGQITTVINYSGDYNMAVVQVPTPYDEDTAHVKDIIQEVADLYYRENEEICLEEPKVVAVTAYNESDVQITVYIKAKGRNHYIIQNGLRFRIKERFDKEGISIPFNQIDVHQVDMPQQK
ncbi:MAG: mechanosensitive ion channel family protein [Erysipelotrichaceae bacterium]|nr:mechanosensitive ion channel family protein [Erysipelotrichaceae bacterium]